MKIKFLTLPLTTMILASISFSTYAVNVIDELNNKAVGHVKWHLQTSVGLDELINKAIPDDDVSIFFVRPADDDTEQTSANIAINDRFQVSLQPGSYTQVYSCSGINRISAVPTGQKTNNLLLNTYNYDLKANNNYFFYVDIDSEGNSTIQEISPEVVSDYFNDKHYQSHQITRVVPHCLISPEPPAPKSAPVLEKEVSIELEVLFETDKAIVRPQYIHEVEQLADFLRLYSNTTAVIQGHTDSRASIPYNQKLSERRANAVKSLLIGQYGISPNRLTAIGYGELHPRATNNTAEGMQQNRRTIAVVKERVRIDQNGNQILD